MFTIQFTQEMQANLYVFGEHLKQETWEKGEVIKDIYASIHNRNK